MILPISTIQQYLCESMLIEDMQCLRHADGTLTVEFFFKGEPIVVVGLSRSHFVSLQALQKLCDQLLADPGLLVQDPASAENSSSGGKAVS